MRQCSGLGLLAPLPHPKDLLGQTMIEWVPIQRPQLRGTDI
jgi:hypothetical protein